MLKTECNHYEQYIKEGVQPTSTVCGTCGLDHPRHMRMCATCGFVGCCESEQSHNTKHFDETGHAIIFSMPLTDTSFTWCYVHLEYLR